MRKAAIVSDESVALASLDDSAEMERRLNTRKAEYGALVFLVVANIVDAITTIVIWQRGGGEANPIAAHLASFNALWPAKAAFVSVLVITHRRLNRFPSALPALWFAAGLYTAAVAINLGNVTR
jgi:hypothetical protein